MPSLRRHRSLAERQRKRRPRVVIAPLVAEVRAIRIAALAQHNVLRRTVDVVPIHGESLRRAKVASYLLHRRRIAAQGLLAGSGHAANPGQKLRQRVLDVHHVPASVCPLRQVGGGLPVLHPFAHRIGQQRVPVLIILGKPVRAAVHDDLFLGKVFLRPQVGLVVLAQLRLQNQPPESLARLRHDRGGNRVRR